MRAHPRFLPVAVVAVLATLSLYAAEPAWAGGGGEDAGTVQSFLNMVCADIGQSPCPQLPTVTQGVLELAGLLDARPEAIRYDQDVPGTAIFAGNTLAQSPVAQAGLTPLAFIGAQTSRGQATPTQLYDPAANSFFFAVTTLGTGTGTLQPENLNLFYDYQLRTIPVFIKGQTVAKISLPLVVLNSSGSERFVCGALGCPASEAMLQISASCTGGAACLSGNISGDFAGSGTQQTYKAADLGVTFNATFGASPVSKLPHATFAVQVPLVVTPANDAPYFNADPITGQATFTAPQLGYSTPVLGSGASVGIPPYAAPPCPGASCPSTTPPPPSAFGFCASFSNNFTGPIANPAPAVAAFVQLGIDGETLASAPLPSPGLDLPECPF
jgi:hypothetical protein